MWLDDFNKCGIIKINKFYYQDRICEYGEIEYTDWTKYDTLYDCYKDLYVSLVYHILIQWI